MTENESVSFNKAVVFLREIGIEVILSETPGKDFFPGLFIDAGRLIVDTNKLVNPGDLLHEAGHIAVVPAAERHTLNAETLALRPQSGGEEMSAIAWSYAVTVYLGINADFLFHETGYKGEGKSLAENFTSGRWVGVPMLQYMGMTAEPHQSAVLNMPAYPAMCKWLRD